MKPPESPSSSPRLPLRSPAVPATAPFSDAPSDAPLLPQQQGHRIWLRRLRVPVLVVLFGCLLLAVLQHLSRSVDYHAVIHSLRTLSPGTWAAALGATALSYVALSARDAVGLRYVCAKVPLSALAIGATVGSALGNATGFGALTGGAVRVRVYGTAGVQAAQVARLTAFTSVSLAVTLAVMSAVGMVSCAHTLSPMFHLTEGALRLTGAAILLGFCAMLLLCGAQPRALTFGAQVDSVSSAAAGWRGWLSGLELTLPSRGVFLAQVLASMADVAAAGLTLYVILPHGSVSFASFLAVYSAALLLGMIGHTPAGLGVFEAAMMFAIGGDVPMSELIVALLAYRAIYFLLPLVLSAGLVAAFEGGLLKARLTSLSANRSFRRLSLLTPMLLSCIIFVAGAMLVFSGAVPAYKQRLQMLSGVLPLWVLEGSQLLSSITGVLLLFVARGLMRRLDAAWWLATGMVAINLGLSLSKGLAFFETGILMIVLALLLSTRKQFHRSASLFAQRFTVGWLLSVAVVIGLAAWLMFFAFRSVPYRSDLWWDFAFDERASRALRTTLVTAFLAALIAVWQLLRLAPGRFVVPAAGDLLEACRIVQAQERSDAGLAMMGDKSFLFSGSRRAFLMYAKRGRTWAALHDPVGPREEWAGLIRDFVTLAHSHGGRAAFYQVRADALPLYLDAGLTLIKLGEEAQLSLDTFSLVGPSRANLRYALKRGERDGLTLEVVTPERVPQYLPTLRRISDAWLDSRSAKEKSFSVAAFTAEYLAAQSAVLIYQNGVAVAFATFMTTDMNVEATIGVMRHVPETSAYTMEYLFTSLALHLKQAGFARLSLGMSPLSGMQPSPLASVWHRLATLTWRFGGRFYNFKGLRAFKDKFQPRWEPRYLAASGSVGVLFTLADLSLLAEGWRS